MSSSKFDPRRRIAIGFAGFSLPDSQGQFRGIDADYCRAIAAAEAAMAS